MLAICIGATTVGCDVGKLTVDGSADLLERAAPAMEEYWDYELAGEATPGAIIQLEGFLRVAPNNPTILEQLAKAYFGYAFGWVEANVERLEFEEEHKKADKQRRRARLMYLRSRNLSMHRVSLEHPEINRETRKSTDELTKWLADTFKKKEQASELLWVGQAWAAYVATSLHDMEIVADLPYAKAFVKRSLELDPAHFHAGGLTFMGIASAVEPGGDLEASKDYFEQALELTERRSLMVHVAMAKFYAVHAGNRTLFDELLREVLDAGDVLAEARLGNRIARERAELYNEYVDQIF